VRDRHQPPAGGPTEVGDPAVVGALVGERQLRILELALPEERAIESWGYLVDYRGRLVTRITFTDGIVTKIEQEA
jgi:hypothetical protein